MLQLITCASSLASRGGTCGGVSAGALDALPRYDWPGNVRELENVIHRAVVLAARPVVHLEDVPLDVAMPETVSLMSRDTLSLREACDEFERQYVLRTLERTRWNVMPRGGCTT